MWNPIHRNLSIIHSESRVYRSILYIVYLSMVKHMPYVLDEFYQIQVNFVWYVFNTPLILIWIISSLRKKFKTLEVAINRNLNILLSGKSWWLISFWTTCFKGTWHSLYVWQELQRRTFIFYSWGYAFKFLQLKFEG